MAARPQRRHLAILAGLAIAGIAAACTPVTYTPPPAPAPAPAPSPTSSVASACPGADAPATNSNVPTRYVAVVDDGDGSPDIEGFTAASQASLNAQVTELAADGTLVSVEPDLPVQALTVNPDDVAYPQQYGLPHAQFDDAWNLPGAYDGSGQVIGVVDTGLDTDHPEFFGRVLAGQQFLNGDGSSSGTNVEDDYGHGTHVAGIAAEGDNSGPNSYGLGGAPAAKLLPVKVLDQNGSGSSVDVAGGIKWAADHDADVINLSLGGGSCGAMQSAIDYARSKQVVVVAAAGNSNTNKLSAPGGNAGVITVGATTSSDQKASFSNYGTYVDIGAPGNAILSTFPSPAVGSRPDGFGSLSGTSMSTPFVAAAVALIKQKCPSLSPDAVQQKIETYHGVSVSGLGAPLIDVANALSNAC